QLTYQELNNKSNQLAHYLHDTYKTQADDIICLLLERSERMIIAILGVLKSGAAYCPISPEYPEERIQFILADTNPKCLIADVDFSLTTIQLPIVDLRSPKLLQTLKTLTIHHSPLIINNLPFTINNLAYIIYTSGTTGNPKGVMVEHRGVVNLKCALNKLLRWHEDEKILSFSSYIFDASIEQYLLALTQGFSLFIISEQYIQNVGRLIDFINEKDITHFDTTPSYFDSLSAVSLPTLHRLILGGEALPDDIKKKALACLSSDALLINSYGPTECTITSLLSINSLQSSSIIGSMISNSSIYILNSNGSLVPQGCIGELYIGGDGVARGYLNRPELTVERFINNPFQTESDKKKNRNSRLYKTGDLVRMLPDGNIEYIGRNDFQVKIRGYRIELGEIENKILEFKNNELINQAVVLVNDKGDNKYLVCYLVATEEINIEDLRNFLSTHLPEYMVPTIFVQLDKLPLTVNGKLDRKFLLALDIGVFEEHLVAPSTELEVHVLNIFADLLSLDPPKISTTTSFFKLGGNSLLAIKLVGKLNKLRNSYLTVADVFKYATVQALAYRLALKRLTHELVFLLNNSKSDQTIFMVHPAIGGSEVYYPLAFELQNDYRCYGVQNYNLYWNDKIQSLSLLAQHYVTGIKAFLSVDAPILLGWSLGGKIALEMAYWLEQHGVRNMTIYLLDTVVLDEKMRTIFEQNVLNTLDNVPQGIDMLLERRHVDEDYRQTVLENISIENVIHKEQLTGRLQYTRCVLFKAILPDKQDVSELFNYSLSLPYNNIDKYVSLENIKVIEMQTNHHEIIKQLPDLVAGILSHE
ncbi:MAG: amino acid adenylation domain-containing protein, partial [Phycisphaerales bacterium]|nr:amino acid adenylation domain-containing protein [Phycisphaerales bacterium]